VDDSLNEAHLRYVELETAVYRQQLASVEGELRLDRGGSVAAGHTHREMERTGIEPVTSGLQSRRSPS
jgi:hypothetical protein